MTQGKPNNPKSKPWVIKIYSGNNGWFYNINHENFTAVGYAYTFEQIQKQVKLVLKNNRIPIKNQFAP